jgi:hypothetical protein
MPVPNPSTPREPVRADAKRNSHHGESAPPNSGDDPMSDPHDADLEQRIKKLIDDQIGPLRQRIEVLEGEAEERRRSEAMQPPPRRRV